MNGSESARARLDALWQKHGLERVPSHLEANETISASALGVVGDLGATVDASSDPGPAPAGAGENSLSLPLIGLTMAPALAPEGGLVGWTAELHATRLLGEGGMGRVVLARQRALERDVAVKLLPTQAPEEWKNALLREARVMGALEHPNIVPVHALGRDSAGKPLLVMKRVEGVMWSQVLAEPEHPAWERLTERSGDRLVASIEVLSGVCNALRFAHSRGFVHRDIKPDNVMLGSFGEVYLVDWGLAVRADACGQCSLAGTPSFMAPEMLECSLERIGPWTDVYLLGATLHMILTGKPRHGGATVAEALTSVYLSERHAFGPDVPAELARLCNGSCSREPAERPASAEAFRVGLVDWLRHRNSEQLATRTAALAGEMASYTEGACSGDTEARRTFDRLATECRFGFSEALQQWPENPIAREGLRACLREMVAIEVARENLDGARSLRAQLTEEEPALDARIGELSRRLDERRAEVERGRSLARELDESLSAPERRAFIVLLILIATVVVVVSRWRVGAQSLSVPRATMFLAVLTTSSGVVAFLLRRRLLTNQFNRRILGLFFVCVLAMLAHRLAAMHRGEHDLRIVLQDDLWLAAALCALGALSIKSSFWQLSVLFAITALILHFVPGSELLFTVSLLVSFFLTRRMLR